MTDRLETLRQKRPHLRPKFWLRREDYDAMRRLIPNEPELPQSYDAWELAAHNEAAQMELHDVVALKVTVAPQGFATFCKRSGFDPSIETLRAYAVALYAKDNFGLA